MSVYCRCEKPKVDSSIDPSVLGSPCEVYNALLNKKNALLAERVRGPVCDPLRFDVQFQLISTMTYMFTLTDNETGEVVSWSVEKQTVDETPQHAFELDYAVSTLRYNSGVRRALEDHLEALQEQYPQEGYQLVSTVHGFLVERAISGTIGLVPFQLDLLPYPGVQPETEPGATSAVWELIGGIPGEAGRALARLIQRYIKLGASWELASSTLTGGLTRNTLIGSAPATDDAHIRFVIQLRDHTATDEQLVVAHSYYAA